MMGEVRNVFVRDVKKQWYLDGINSEINSIPKLVDFLKTLSEGMETVCVGNSAGGYAASLVGSLMDANRVLNFSGQFELNSFIESDADRGLNPVVLRHSHLSESREVFNIRKIIENSRVPQLYMYPEGCPLDRRQAEVVEGLKNVHVIRLDSSDHGDGCYHSNFQSLYGMSSKQIKTLAAECGERPVSKLRFSMRVSGKVKTLDYLARRLCKAVFSRCLRFFRSRTGCLAWMLMNWVGVGIF